jgi:hypothetical protein
MRRRTFLTYCLRAITVRVTDWGEAHKYAFTGDVSHAGAVRLVATRPSVGMHGGRIGTMRNGRETHDGPRC